MPVLARLAAFASLPLKKDRSRKGPNQWEAPFAVYRTLAMLAYAMIIDTYVYRQDVMV